MVNGMKMPWAVRIALWWFVLLAIACCVPLVHVQVKWFDEDCQGLGWMVWMHVVCLGYIAIGVGFVAAILRGRRNWVAIPYFLIGLLAFSAPITGSHPPALTVGMRIYLISVAVGTVVPLVLLYGPRSSNLWFMAFPRRRGLGTGCCTLVVLAIAGMMMSMVDVAAPRRKMDVANLGATSMRGRSVFQLLMLNEVARDDGAQGVEVSACTNSCELVAELCACFTNETGLAAWSNEWSFAVNMPEQTPNSFPVMITANVDPAGLPREWDGVTDKDELLKLKPLEGAEPLGFGNRAVVIVRNDGKAEVIRCEYMTLGAIFGNEPFKLGKDTYYLTPVGKRKADDR